jgi:hypothetical protein
LFFSGYPTETWDDFLDTVRMFHRYQRYAADGTLQKLALGTPYQYIFDTPMDDLVSKYQMQVGDFGDLWTAGVNPELHYLERIRRRMILQEACCLLNLPVSRNYYELLFMMNTVRSKRREILDFFDLHDYQFETHANITGDDRLGDRLFMPAELQQEMMQGIADAHVELELAVESDDPLWKPEIQLQVGGKIEKHTITGDSLKIEFRGTLAPGSRLALTLLNQPADSTHFWTGGDYNHYSCKQVLIKRFVLCGVDMLTKNHLDQHFRQTLLVEPNGQAHIKSLFAWPQQAKHLWRMWTNLTIACDFELPVLTELAGWMLDANADQVPDWKVMHEFRDYLVDFHTQLSYNNSIIHH